MQMVCQLSEVRCTWARELLSMDKFGVFLHLFKADCAVVVRLLAGCERARFSAGVMLCCGI